MLRYWFLLHRYLGIACGLVMLLWTLSGIVMMYHSYPRLDDYKALTLQEPLHLDKCCQLPGQDPSGGKALQQLRLDMQHGQPVLRFYTDNQHHYNINLQEGTLFTRYSMADAHPIAQHFQQYYVTGNTLKPVTGTTIERDQWTVYSSYNPHRPLHRFSLHDRAGTEIYISSKSGEMIQITNSNERLWGYLGAVIHWIYPTALRQHGTSWYYLIIVLSSLGIFLTTTGLFIGIKQFKRRRSGKLSPYRGLALFHHYFGFVFGILTLSWVLSGLLSMNPAGLLEGSNDHQEKRQLSGEAMNWQGLEKLIFMLQKNPHFAATTTRLSWHSIGEQVALVSHQSDGNKTRYNADTLQLAPLNESQLKQLGQRMLGNRYATGTLLFQADEYYYAHHKPIELPVYRIVSDNGSRYYLSASSGELIKKIDRNEQWNRWLFNGLHSLDFSEAMRQRPVWDAILIPLLICVAIVCATGSYMGVKRLFLTKRRRHSRKKRDQAKEARQS